MKIKNILVLEKRYTVTLSHMGANPKRIVCGGGGGGGNTFFFSDRRQPRKSRKSQKS